MLALVKREKRARNKEQRKQQKAKISVPYFKTEKRNGKTR